MTEMPSRRVDDDRLLMLERSNQDIVLQIVDVKNEIKNWQGNQLQLITMMQKTLDRHDTLLVGKDGGNGLVADNADWKRIESVRTWHLRAIWVVLAGVITKWISGLEMWK